MAKDFWGWLTNWEILGVKYNKDQDSLDPEQVADELVDKFVGFTAATRGTIDGVLILVDEADRPEVSAGLGEFLKFFTERLARKDCNNVLLGLAVDVAPKFYPAMSGIRLMVAACAAWVKVAA